MPKVSLSGMTVEALMDLRMRVDEMLLTEIEKQLERMDRTIAVIGLRRVARGGGRGLEGVKGSPKKCSPSGGNWGGRGARPRWPVSVMKGGKKMRGFLIDKSARKGRKKRRSKR